MEPPVLLGPFGGGSAPDVLAGLDDDGSGEDALFDDADELQRLRSMVQMVRGELDAARAEVLAVTAHSPPKRHSRAPFPAHCGCSCARARALSPYRPLCRRHSSCGMR